MPYSVATEIVLRLLRDLDRRQGVYALGRAEAYFVMQQEVVQVFPMMQRAKAKHPAMFIGTSGQRRVLVVYRAAIPSGAGG
jgi:16S rRNA A1518/A1519 N6-dimethyltransferase RsmA/KsgA/DIM1 with predicted DNA glycosylase/AP lyase activity